MDLPPIQGTLESFLQDYSSKASILWHSTFVIVQLSHPYTTSGKAIVLTRENFVGKVMSLLLNVLSRLFTAFLPRSKHLSFMAAVTICSNFGTAPKKSLTVSIVSPSICHKVIGLDAMILVF